MQFFEISFFEDLNLEDTSLENDPKNFQKCPCFETNETFYYLILMAFVMENRNFTHIYLGTMILCLQNNYKMRQSWFETIFNPQM